MTRKLTISLLFCCSPILADLLPVGTGITVSDGILPQSASLDSISFGSLNPAFPPSGSIQLTTQHSVGGGTLDASMFAQAAFGEMRASSVTSLTSTASGVVATANGGAQVTDIMTVNFAPFTGSMGLLEVDYTLDGTVALGGTLSSSSAVLGVSAFVCSNYSFVIGNCVDPGFTSQANTFTSSVSGTFAFPQFFRFTYGTPFDFHFGLFATTDVGPGASAIADASDTLILSGLKVFDAQGDPVPEATFTSGSGTQYTQSGVVPEPATFLLLLPGLALIAVLARKAAPYPTRN